MKDSKPNISLTNLAEVQSSGVLLSLRKGINELFNKKSRKSQFSAASLKAVEYSKTISVIICTANRGRLAENAVDSILNQRFDGSKYEILVVNNSPDPLPYKFKSDRVIIVDEPNLGLSIARNRGASAAKGEYLLYIDDDAVANENLLSSIFSAFENQRAAIIGGQIFLALPEPVPDVFLEGKESLWSAYTVPYSSFREIREQYEFPYGACFGIRHSVLDTLGGFPENYGRTGNNYAGGEETALCFAAKNMGFKLGIEPNASVIHKVLPDRFTKEHIRRTIREGIITTYRLCLDGYSTSGWTPQYVDERLRIIKKELLRMNGLPAFYKRCEYDAFSELKDIMTQKSSDKE